MEVKEPTEYFIPAAALEHPANPEFANLRDKIIYAIRRYEQNSDFQSNLEVIDLVPFVSTRKIQFNKERMGYDVLAIVT